MPALTLALVTAADPVGAAEGGGAGAVQRPGGRQGGAAVVVGHGLDQRERGRLVVVVDGAVRGLTEAEDDRSAGLSATGAGPGTGGVSGRTARLGEAVGAGVDGALVTAVDPVVPEMLVGPLAESVQSVPSALPPLSLVTVLISVSVAGWSSLSIVHVASSPGPSTSDDPVSVPSVQVQSAAR